MDINDLVEGLDPSVLSSISGSQLLQLIRDAVPSDSRGITIYDDTEPDVVTYPRFARYSWFKPSENNKIHRRYNPSTATWEPVAVQNSTINTDQIVDGAITLSKLYNPNDITKALYLLRVNAAGNGFELWQLTFADNSIAFSKITRGANNTFPHVKSDGSAWEDLTADQIAQLFSGGAVTYDQISGDTNYAMFYHDTATGQLKELAPGSERQTLKIVAGKPTWVTVPTQLLTTKTDSGLQALPAAAGVVTIDHGFTGVPTIVNVTIECISTDNGYAAGDVLPISSVFLSNGAGVEYPVVVSTDIDNVNVIFSANFLDSLNKTGTAIGVLDRTKWNLRVVAIS